MAVKNDGVDSRADLETIKVQCITPSASTGYLQNRWGNGAPEVKGGNPGKQQRKLFLGKNTS